MVTPNEVRSLKDGEHTKSQSLGHSETRESQEAPLLRPVEAGWKWAHIKESGFHPKGKAQRQISRTTHKQISANS